MADDRSSLTLPLDTDENGEVLLRRDSHTLRRARARSKERTPTMVVTDAFTFLNDHHISIVDAVEEGCLQTEVGKLCNFEQDLDDEKSPEKCVGKETESASVTDSDDHHLDLDNSDSDGLPLTEFCYSKDSGFASLERHAHNVDEPSERKCQDLNDISGKCRSSPDVHNSHNSNGVDSADGDLSCSGTKEVSSIKNQTQTTEDIDSSSGDVFIVDTTVNSPVLGGELSQTKDESHEAQLRLREDNDRRQGCDDVEKYVTCNDAEEVVLRRSVIRSMSEDADSSGHRPSRSGIVLEANPLTDIGSDDSSDEDTGIYAESFRRSNWVRVNQEGKLEAEDTKVKLPPSAPFVTNGSIRSTSTSTSGVSSMTTEDGEDRMKEDFFSESGLPGVSHNRFHKRSDSVTTTDSEQDFKNRYMSRRRCLIQRADSQKEYHRLSARIYDEDKVVVLERGSDSEDLGLHLLDSHPAYITSVDPDSPAEKAGIVDGQILVSVNDFNVLTTDHDDIIKLIQDCTGPITLGVASSDFEPIRDLQAPVISGFMFKLGNNSLVRMWKKRYFVLRNDNCLYYYKAEQDLDPLGALPLSGYTISRHTDTSRDYCFKADKYRARTYYFMTENRDQLTEWVGALTEAAVKSKKQKDTSSFMSVSSHNVSLPALDIRRPECSGYLLKLSPHSRTWRRRYCLLKDACVYYYKDVNAFSALGVAHLHGYTVDVEGSKKRNSFILKPPDEKMRQFCFAADNNTDKKRWVEAIIHSIQRWVPVERNTDC